MKSILFATTALVASTSFAMADVDLSGAAEMGIFGNDGIDTQFHTDIDVTFSMSGETDGGLTFGAEIDLDESDTDRTISGVAVDDDGSGGLVADDIAVGGSPAFDAASQGGEVIFISGAFGTLTMGDTDGAFDFALSEAIIGGAIQDDHEHAGYSGNSGLDGLYDGQIARYDYSFGDFAVAVSAEIFDGFDNDGVDADPVLGVGFTYNGEFAGVSFGAGLGYQQADDLKIYGISLDGSMDNGISGVINYSRLEDDATDSEVDHFGVALGYEAGALLVAANYGQFDFGNDFEDSGYGVIANYDLGGGAELQAGYGNSSFDTPTGDSDFDSFSFGISMSF